MSVFRTIESKIEGLFEGVFGRAFRTHVQPIELARKLAKEMDDHRTVSVSRVYVPNEYTMYLSPSDREQLSGYEESLVGELEEYLAEHARRERYALLTAPKVLVTSDARPRRRRVRDRDAPRVRGPGEAAPEPPPSLPDLPLDQPAQTMIYRPPVRARRARRRRTARPAGARGRHAHLRRPQAGDHLAARRPRPLALVRRPPRRRERLPAPCGDSPGRSDVLDRRPRLDERHAPERDERRARAVRDGDTITLGSSEIVFGRSLP